LIEVSDLRKRYRNAAAVNGLSFRVTDGRITGFLGPNGAGKTTTLRILLGLVQPTSGRATIDGRAYRELDEPIRRVGAVLEASDYHPKRSGRNHLRVLCTAAGLPWGRADELLEFVGLENAGGRAVGGYSLGMRQRLSVAGALLGEPDVLVLDEPANGLDPEGIRWLRDFLRSFAAGGKTVFISSHVLAEVEQIADEAVIIHKGRLVAHESVADLRARSAPRACGRRMLSRCKTRSPRRASNRRSTATD
jgi:ABC-2 type transport system ATP-binding protein